MWTNVHITVVHTRKQVRALLEVGPLKAAVAMMIL